MAAALAAEDLSRQASMSSRRSMSSKMSWRASSVREMFNAPDVFQRSSRQPEFNDEEELRWAAIERLPTYDRLRKGMLTQVTSTGNVMRDEVDVTNLGPQAKKQLMDSILKVVEEDNERVGIEVPKIEVRFQNLSVEGDAFVGTRALPTLINSTLNAIEATLGYVGLTPSKKRVIKILQGVSGVLKPSRMTLLLGPPASGKTTLLQTLAGKAKDDLRISGKVSYCGHEFSEFIPQRTSAYISQHDLHNGEMTVRETLDFAGRCLGVGTRYEMLAELSRREKEAGIKPDPEIDAFMKATAMAGQETSLITDYVLKILGLDICADILVGDDMRRGISGGQKKRVTTAFNSFHIGQQLSEELRLPFDKSKSHPAALVTEKYGISNRDLFKACLSREWLLMKRSTFLYIFKVFQLTVMAIIALTVFLRTEMKAGRIEDSAKFWGALFFSLINVMFNGMTELAMTVFRLPVFFKQRDNMFYPAWAFALPIWLTRIPVSLVESGIWIILTYYTIGFAPGASRFFKQFLAFFGVNQMALSLFRFIAALGRTEVVANTLGTFTLLLVFVLGGFIVAKDAIEPWMIWGYYVSPMMYGQNAIAINEFLADRWSTPLLNSTVGKTLLKERGLYTEEHWYWICIGALVGFSLLFNLLFIAALTYLNPLGDSRPTISDDDSEKERKRQITSNGEGIDMPVRNAQASTGSIVSVANNQSKKGMVLPFQPLSLAFNHVNYYVDMPESVVSIERTVFYRERAAGMYSELPYAFAQVAIETIYVAFQTIMYALLLYSMIGYEWKADKFFYFYYFIFMCFTYMSMYGMMVVALTPGHQIAAIVSSFLLSFWNLFSGFLIPRPLIPIWWRWYYWGSPVAWTIYGIFTSQIGDKVEDVTLSSGDKMAVNRFLKDILGFDEDFLKYIVLGHVAWVLVFFFVFAYSIKCFNFQKR
ncbi:ABC-2 type transporter [Corchorus olitorius]|uniref:ABC-2 type transporter n=1 Tax=Corchorus olitorius TaxID=93759 RepID=A0A1R3J2M7_9ROSI|nr:ABC-2 type transporter [Corchorus olitorius]